MPRPWQGGPLDCRHIPWEELANVWDQILKRQTAGLGLVKEARKNPRRMAIKEQEDMIARLTFLDVSRKVQGRSDDRQPEQTVRSDKHARGSRRGSESKKDEA